MKKYAKYMALAVTLTLLGLIFYFSAQPGAVSYKVSETVMNTVQSGKAKAITPQWFSTTNLNVNVRKWAHVYIYCALGVSMAVTVDGQPWPVAEGAAVCGTVYAVCRRGRAAPVLCPGPCHAAERCRHRCNGLSALHRGGLSLHPGVSWLPEVSILPVG